MFPILNSPPGEGVSAMNSSALRVLVTAVGGDLGQALVKALRIGLVDFEISGCDVDPCGVGSAFVSVFEAVPAASDSAGYVSALDDLCRRHRVDAVIPASEAEIAVLSGLGPQLPCATAIVCQPWEWFQKFGDKLRCMQALSPHLQLVPFADSSNSESMKQLVDRVGFPLVVKARRSRGSLAVRVVRNPGELERLIGEGTENLVQQFIDDREGEFSVGIFASPHFTEVLAFRRELRGAGCSWFAETSEDASVIQYALEFAKASCLQGSANIQLRKNRGQVYLLEVNARFSSLVAARAICGFRDAEWSVQAGLGRPLSPPPIAYGKIKFRRFFHELVDTGAGYSAIAEWMPSQVHASSEAKQG